MSFAYMNWYTGDYLRDTRHLTPLKHGCYMLLLMHCWDSRGPVPLDEQECAGIANCRSSDEIDSMRYVIDRYFVRMEDGFYNTRMQREIEKAQALSAKRSHAGFVGYKAVSKSLKKKDIQASARQVSGNCSASASNTNTNTNLNTNTNKVKNTTPASRTMLCPDRVSTEVWEDFLLLRKQKKAAVTGTALVGIQREAEKAGISLDAALRMCCERGWAGFKASWTNGKVDMASEMEQFAQMVLSQEKDISNG